MTTTTPNTIDWYHGPTGLEVRGSGELRPTDGILRAAAQSIAHDLEQPLGSMIWDEEAAPFEVAAEGSRLPMMVGQDLNAGWVRSCRREVSRVARLPRWRDWVESADIVDIRADGDAVSFTIAVAAGGAVITATSRIGG